MQTIDFIHPEDAAALEALQKIPVLPKVVKSFLDIGIEQLTTGLNMAMKVRLSPTQLPELYHILPPICELLDIKEPDFLTSRCRIFVLDLSTSDIVMKDIGS